MATTVAWTVFTLPLVLEEKDRLTKRRVTWELGTPGMSLPTALVLEVAVLSVLTQDTCCVRTSPREHFNTADSLTQLPRAHTRMALRVFDGLGSREPVWSSLTFVLIGDGTVVTEGWFSSCSFYWF